MKMKQTEEKIMYLTNIRLNTKNYGVNSFNSLRIKIAPKTKRMHAAPKFPFKANQKLKYIATRKKHISVLKNKLNHSFKLLKYGQINLILNYVGSILIN